MVMDKLDSIAVVGTATAVIGTASQIDQVRSWISLAVTIIGALCTFVPIFIRWWKKAKADGKITIDEIQEGVEIVKRGKDSVQQILNDHNQKKGDKDENQ